LDRIKNNLFESYRKTACLGLGGRRLPSMDEVSRLLQKMFALLYPDYYYGPGENDVEKFTSLVVSDLYDQLSRLIQICISSRPNTDFQSMPSTRGQACCLEFLEKIPELRETLQCDVQAAMDGDPAANACEEIILGYPGFYAVTVYRVAHALCRMTIPLLPRMMTEIAHRHTGIDIHPGAQIGRYFFIDHGTGVVIGETAVIGDYVKLYQGVTLGALSFPKDEAGYLIRRAVRHPQIGKGATIYANATILGGDTSVGDECVIGGSAFITKSVDASHTVKIAAPELMLKQHGIKKQSQRKLHSKPKSSIS